MRMTTFRTAVLVTASAILSVPAFATTYQEVSYSGYVMKTDTLVGTMRPSDSITNITDISGLTGGSSWGSSFKGTPYSQVDVADNGAKLVVQFKQYESPYTKCVVVEFTKDTAGNIYAKATKAAYKQDSSGPRYDIDFSQSGNYTGSNVATSDSAGNYGVKGLSFYVPTAAANPQFTFNSTTTTDINEPTAWVCGYVPVGEDVTISGVGVTASLATANCIPAFSSITVVDGATLHVAASNDLPLVTLGGGTTLSVSGANAVAVLSGLTTTAPTGGTPAATLSVLNGAKAILPGGTGLKNLMLRMDHGTLANDGTGALTLGTALANETAVFGLVAVDSTIAMLNNKALNFMNPASGGTVTPIGDLALTNCLISVGTGSISFGVNNPTSTPFTVRCHGTDLGITSTSTSSSTFTFAGAGTVALSGGGRFYRVVCSNPQGGNFTPTFQDRGRLTLTGKNSGYPVDFFFPFCGNGGGRIVSKPDDDGFETIEFTGTRAWIWNPKPSSNSGSNGKAVWRVADSSFAFNMTDWWGQQQVPFHGLKAVEIADGTTLTLERRKLGGGSAYNYGDSNFGGSGDASGETTIRLADVPFTGGGSLIVTNTYNKEFHVLVTCGSNSATGTVAACDYDAANAGKTKILFNDGANWAGTVVAGGNIALVKNSKTSLNDKFVDSGEPATVSFGGIRFDENMTLRLWSDGSCDKINIGPLGFSGNSTFAFAVQENYDPVPGDRWVIGTMPVGTSAPTLSSAQWRLSTEAIDGDASRVSLVLSVADIDFTFNSTTTTDINDPTGWTCGYVPVGEDVLITGRNVRVVLDTANSMPAFASVSVRDGATLVVTATNNLPAIELRSGASFVVDGATAVLTALSAVAPREGESLASFSILNGGTAIVPGGTGLKNMSVNLDGGTLATMGEGDLTFGYAADGETANFDISATGATVSTAAGNINFACPEDGGTVASTGTWTFASTTFTHGSAYGFDLGRRNPASSAIDIVFDNTVLNYKNGDHYIEGGVHAIFRNGAQLYRNNASATANVYVRGDATLEFQTGTLFQFGLSQLNGGVGNGRIDFSPTTDGHVALILDNARMDVFHYEGNSKAVAEIRDTNLVTQSYNAWNRSEIFKGFKSVQLDAGAELVQSIGPDGGSNGGPVGNNIDNVTSADQKAYFTGTGSFTFSNAIPAKTRTYNLTSSANTATGVLRGTPDQNAIISVNTGANWAGTVIWDGGVSLTATEGTPFSYTFGGVRADVPFTFRLWGDKSCDTVNLTGEGWTGSAEPLFALQGGYDPVPGDRWVLGTIPVGTSAPALSSARWHFSTEAIDGDADNVRLVLTAASVDFTFNSTTTTDINNPTGWTCGYVPVGESVAITGRNVRVILDATNCIPAFTSISVRDGATLMVTETNDLPAIDLRSGASLVVDGATAVLSAFSTVAPGEGESVAGFSILNGGTALVPGGTSFKNIYLRMEGGSLVNDGSGPLYLGTALANESAIFGLVATNSTIATRNHTALYFMTPAAGGAVTPIGDLALTNSVVNTGTGAIHFGVNNPTNIPFTVRFHGTDLAIGIDMVTDNSSAMTFAGAATVALSGGAHFYHCSPYSGQKGHFSPTFLQRGRMTLEGTGDSLPADFRYPFLGNGNSAIVSTPDEDGFVTQEFIGTRASIWTPVPNANNSSNGKAVWKIADSSFAYGMLAWWWQTQLPFHGLKAVEIADGTALTLVRRKLGSPWSDYGDTQIGSGDAAEDASGSYTLRLANVPFTGGGSVIVTNTYNRDFHVLVSCGGNTATGTIAAYDTSATYAGKTKVLFNDGANWAGTVVASDGIAFVKNSAASLNDYFSDSGDPVTVSFGGVRFDGDLTLRLWANGTADQVNFGNLGFSGPGGIAFAFQDGDEPNRGKWVVGTKPKSVAVPPTAARLWRISAKPIDETTDQLIASPITGLFIILK